MGSSALLIPFLLPQVMHFFHKATDPRLIDKVGEHAVLFKGGGGYATVGDAQLLLDVFQTHPGIRQHHGIRYRFFNPLQQGAVGACARRQTRDAKGVRMVVKDRGFGNGTNIAITQIHRRFRHNVEQRFDFTCADAVLMTNGLADVRVPDPQSRWRRHR